MPMLLFELAAVARPRRLIIGTCAALFACIGSASAQDRGVGFNASSVPAYAGGHPAIDGYIDAHQSDDLKQLQRWIRQRSISAQGDGVLEMSGMLQKDLMQLGCQAQLNPTEGFPGVWASCAEGARRTIVVYLMYDVQPAERASWRSDPFAANVVDDPDLGRVLIGRGANDKKGPERAFLNAVAAIRAVAGRLPVNILFAAEGEEEVGSPHYPQILSLHAKELRVASGVLFPSQSQSSSGDVSLYLGAKGLLYFELEAAGGVHGGPLDAEIHSSNKAIVDAPAWRLSQALATLTSTDGNRVVVSGFYDDIRVPTASELDLLRGWKANWSDHESDLKHSLHVSRWIEDWSGARASYEYFFGSTLNIDGLGAGYVGSGMRTILPPTAVAKLDARLVPDQDPDAILALIRKHLDERGFKDVTIRKLAGYPAAQTSLESPFVLSAIGTLNKYGRPPMVAPRHPGSSPYYVFTKELRLPFVSVGLGFGRAAHAPNELMVIEPRKGLAIDGLAQSEKFFVDLLYAWGAQ